MSPSLPQTLPAKSEELYEINELLARFIELRGTKGVEVMAHAFITKLQFLGANPPRMSNGDSYLEPTEAWAHVRDLFIRKYKITETYYDVCYDSETPAQQTVRETIRTLWPVEHPPLTIHKWMRGQVLQAPNGQPYEAAGGTCSDCGSPMVFNDSDTRICLDDELCGHVADG